MSGPREDQAPPPPLPPRTLAFGNYYRSALGVKHGAPDTPLILYGHDALDAAAFFSQASTLSTLAVRGLDNLRRALDQLDVLGIYAMSRPEYPGEAGEAIRLLRARFDPTTGARRASFYGAWTYDVDAAIAYALDCGADAVVMPDVDARELFHYVFAVLAAIETQKPLPTTAQAHRDQLKLGFPNSPFWHKRDVVAPTTY